MFIKLLKKIIFLESYAIQRDFVYHFNKKILMKLCNYENEEDYKRDFNILKDKGLINITYKKSVVDGKWSSNIESYKVINERIKKINERIKQEGKTDLWRSFKDIYNRLHCKFDKKKFKVYYGTKIKTLLDMKCKVAIWKKNWEAKASKEQENKKSFTTNNKKIENKQTYFKIDNNKQLKDMNKEEATQFLKSKEDKAESGLAKDIISFFSKRVAEKFNASNENNRNDNNNYFRINENIENDNVRNDNLPNNENNDNIHNNENNENENNEKDLYNEYVNRINLINEKVGRLMEWERSTGFYYFSDKKIYIKDMLEFINNYNK